MTETAFPALTLVAATAGSTKERKPGPNFDDRPDGGLIRACDLVRDPKNPNRTSVLDISLSTLWRYVNANKFPQPVRLSRGVVAWRVGDVREWISKLHVVALALSA